MQIGNTTKSYGLVSQKLHWIIAILIVGLLAVGWYMADMPRSPEKFQLYGVHKAIGIIVLALAVLRISWVVLQPKPETLGSESKLQIVAAKAVHGFLYLWMLAMPLSGWLMSSAGGHPVSVFGLFTMPTLVEKGSSLGGIAHEVHETLPVIGVLLLVAHIGAAVYHHVILKDDTLRRIMPGYKYRDPELGTK